jgi:hypothetical protein
MALIDKLNNLGEAVRERAGLTEELTIDEMADVVRNIPQPDLSPYATIVYVDEQIENIELTPGPAGKDGKDGVDGKDGKDGAPGADGKDYVLTEADKQEIAGMVEVPGGGGGSVAVDGVSIIENADGTISAAVGGGKAVDQPETVALNGDTDVTNWGEGNGRIVIKSIDWLYSNPMLKWDKTLKYRLYVEGRKVSTGTTCVVDCLIEYRDDNNWQCEGGNPVAFNNGTIKTVSWNSAQGIYLDTTNTTYNDDFVTKAFIYKPATYKYNHIDSKYINIGDSLNINASGQINTNLKGLFVVGNSSTPTLYNSGNTLLNTPQCSTILGERNIVDSASEGCVLLGRRNHAEFATGLVAIGEDNMTSGWASMAYGFENNSQSAHTLCFGGGLIGGNTYTMLYGKYNLNNSGYNVIIGNGSSSSSRANGLTIAADGTITTQGTISNSGADYAEYFEWLDGNPNGEDRVGLIVALEGGKIRPAKAVDDILGVVSGTATVLGDDAEWVWQGKYLRDDFGRLIMTEIELPANEDGTEFTKIMTPAINPEYDESKPYTSRANRAEWDAIGMMGKLYVKDDGTCIVNGYAMPGENGVATLATGKSNMRVMERINDHIIRVLLK